jgi:hypothetical protein
MKINQLILLLKEVRFHYYCIILFIYILFIYLDNVIENDKYKSSIKYRREKYLKLR